MPRIDINVSAEDQSDGELVSRLINSTLNHNGFTDVALVHNSGSDQETNEDVLEAMRNLSPSVFSSEVTIGVSEFEEDEVVVPGEGEEFPTPDDEDEG